MNIKAIIKSLFCKRDVAVSKQELLSRHIKFGVEGIYVSRGYYCTEHSKYQVLTSSELSKAEGQSIGSCSLMNNGKIEFYYFFKC